MRSMDDELEPALVVDEREVPARVRGLPHLHDAEVQVHVPVLAPQVEVDDPVGEEVLPVVRRTCRCPAASP